MRIACNASSYMQVAVAVALSALAACDTQEARTGKDAAASSGDGGVEQPGWCQAKAIFDEHCVACHDGAGTAGAPMALKTHDQLLAASAMYPGSKLHERVAARVRQEKDPMPPQGGLGTAEITLLQRWSERGAPLGDAASCEQETPGPEGSAWPEDCPESYEFRAGQAGKPHVIAPNSETHPAFYFDAPWGNEPVQAIAFRPLTDNKKVIHHWILYQGESSYLIGWSPGKTEQPLPGDVGLFMPSAGKLKLDVHYYNLNNEEQQTDQSGVEVCVTRAPRPNVATTFPFAASASAPAMSTVTNTNTCTVEAEGPIRLITSSPHMHKLGISAKLEVLRTDGSVIVVTDEPYSFEEQRRYPVDLIIHSGDQIRTTCVYDNPTATPVSFGQDSDDEMCFNFAMFYPICGMRCVGGDPRVAFLTASQGGGCPSGADL